MSDVAKKMEELKNKVQEARESCEAKKKQIKEEAQRLLEINKQRPLTPEEWQKFLELTQ